MTDGFHLIIDALKLNGLNTIYGVPGIPITDFGRMAQAEGIRVRIAQRTMQFAFERKRFDDTEKLHGPQGPFSGDDIVDIILEQPESSEYITRKLWVYFGSDNPSATTIQALAAHLRQSDYDLASTIKEMFMSEEFYSPGVVRQQVKARAIPRPDRPHSRGPPCLTLPPWSRPAVKWDKNFRPPNVKGWEGGATGSVLPPCSCATIWRDTSSAAKPPHSAASGAPPDRLRCP